MYSIKDKAVKEMCELLEMEPTTAQLCDSIVETGINPEDVLEIARRNYEEVTAWYESLNRNN